MSFDVTKPFMGSAFDAQESVGSLKMPQIKHAYFRGQTVTLDGWRMTGCKFESCTLEVSTSYFVIERCFVDADTVVSWAGEAVNLIQLFHMRDDSMRADQPGFAATKHTDGSYSIGA